MQTKRVLKKGVRETILITILVIIGIFLAIKVFKVYTDDTHRLSKLGYTADQIKKITELNEQNLFLTHEYHTKLLDIITSKYYIAKNLDAYLAYFDEHKDSKIEDIIAIINVGSNKDYYPDNTNTDTTKGLAMLVNKYHKLNQDYTPDNLVSIKNWYAYGNQSINQEVYTSYISMFNAAKKEDLTIIINDAYRTYEEQEKLEQKNGDKAAKAGYSEHNTGLAINVTTNYSYDNFEDTDEYKWLVTHAHEYGFILRYPKDLEYLTGYEFEPGHLRYLGVDLATKVYESNLTFDEYYAYYLDK